MTEFTRNSCSDGPSSVSRPARQDHRKEKEKDASSESTAKGNSQRNRPGAR